MVDTSTAENVYNIASSSATYLTDFLPVLYAFFGLLLSLFVIAIILKIFKRIKF